MTHHITAMLNAHPGGTGTEDKEKLAACIAACFECAQTCTACADSCLAEEKVADLARCIRTDLDCADICAVTGAVLTRQTGDSSAIAGQCSRPAGPPVPRAPPNAKSMRKCMNTAGSAPRPAAAAKTPARRSWSHSPRRTAAAPGSGCAAVGLVSTHILPFSRYSLLCTSRREPRPNPCMTEMTVAQARSRLLEAVDMARISHEPVHRLHRGRRVAALIDPACAGPPVPGRPPSNGRTRQGGDMRAACHRLQGVAGLLRRGRCAPVRVRPAESLPSCGRSPTPGLHPLPRGQSWPRRR
jgi:hypothetical protein